MDTSDSPRTRPASTDTAEPHEPAGGPRTGPMRRMPRFTPRHDPASAGYDPAADAPAPPLPQRPPARPAPPAGWAPVPPPPAVSRGVRPEPVRAVIGDEIRIPFIWCEFGTCDATYTHPDALGERDLRARALAAGWRYDALGRRACPSCAQHDPTFWTARPPAPVGGDWRRAG
jgi:hypothetical protein